MLCLSPLPTNVPAPPCVPACPSCRLSQDLELKEHSLRLLQERMQGSEAHQLAEAAATAERELGEAQAAVVAAQDKKKEMVAAAKVGRDAASLSGHMGVGGCALGLRPGAREEGAWAHQPSPLPPCLLRLVVPPQELQHQIANFGKERDSRIKAAKDKVGQEGCGGGTRLGVDGQRLGVVGQRRRHRCLPPWPRRLPLRPTPHPSDCGGQEGGGGGQEGAQGQADRAAGHAGRGGGRRRRAQGAGRAAGGGAEDGQGAAEAGGRGWVCWGPA